MARKKSIELPQEELDQLVNNEISAKDLGEKYNKPRGYFDNIKHNQKLKTSFTMNQADTNIMDQGSSINSNTQLNQNQIIDNKPTIDYQFAVKGFWRGVDGVLKFMSVVSRGSMEYTSLPDDKIDKLTDVTFNDPIIQKVSTLGGVSSLVTVGAIVGTFAPQIKIKKKIKHDVNNFDCKCDKCVKERKLFEKSDLTDVKELVQVKETTKEDENKFIQSTVNKIESVISEPPKVTSSGLIIERNIPKQITEDQVIKQNTGVKNGQ